MYTLLLLLLLLLLIIFFGLPCSYATKNRTFDHMFKRTKSLNTWTNLLLVIIIIIIIIIIILTKLDPTM
jgi:putative copper export protein